MVVTSREELVVKGHRFDVLYTYNGHGYWIAKIIGLDFTVSSESRQTCKAMLTTNIEYLLDTVELT